MYYHIIVNSVIVVWLCTICSLHIKQVIVILKCRLVEKTRGNERVDTQKINRVDSGRLSVFQMALIDTPSKNNTTPKYIKKKKAVFLNHCCIIDFKHVRMGT